MKIGWPDVWIIRLLPHCFHCSLFDNFYIPTVKCDWGMEGNNFFYRVFQVVYLLRLSHSHPRQFDWIKTNNYLDIASYVSVSLSHIGRNLSTHSHTFIYNFIFKRSLLNLSQHICFSPLKSHSKYSVIRNHKNISFFWQIRHSITDRWKSQNV